MTQHKYKVELAAFHITERCTHCCPMCYINASQNKKQHPVLSQNMQVADELIRYGIKEVTLLGGDPAQYPGVTKIAEHFYNNEITVSILSNTLDFGEQYVDDAGKYIDAFEATIHSHIEDEHDSFCKTKGAFNKIVNNLKIFSDKRKKIGIAINVTAFTYDSIIKIVSSLCDIHHINLSYIIIQRIIPMGRATSISNFTLGRGQVITAINQLKKIQQEYDVQIIMEDPVPLCILPHEIQYFISPCKWGISKVAINSNGDTSRCGADPRYRLGNIFEKSLDEIWNSSDVLNSFRNKSYLPGRCHACDLLTQCGGGCSLSCEIEKDHSIDYLFSQYDKRDKKIHGSLQFEKLHKGELSSILQIEWANFSGYGHVFSVDSLKHWYKHNSSMFMVVKDVHNWILGYTVLVPITKKLFNKIKQGIYSSLLDFPAREVLHGNSSPYYHIEVIATIHKSKATRAGSFLIKQVGERLLCKEVKFITASPVKDIGVNLCTYFEFKHVADETYKGEIYPIYLLEVNKNTHNKLKRF